MENKIMTADENEESIAVNYLEELEARLMIKFNELSKNNDVRVLGMADALDFIREMTDAVKGGFRV